MSTDQEETTFDAGMFGIYVDEAAYYARLGKLFAPADASPFFDVVGIDLGETQ